MNRFLTLFLLIPVIALCQQPDAVLEAARKKLQAKNYAAAKADLTKIIDANPKNKSALSLRGQARMGMEDYYGAISDFSFALEIDSTFAEALNFRGESKINLGDDESAIVDLDRAIRFNAKYTEAYTNRGFAKYNVEDLQGAYFDFSKALELGPADADKYFNRGLVKSELGEFISAIDDYTKSIELDKTDANLYNYRGVAYYNTSNFDKAIVDYNEAIRLDLKDPFKYENRALAKTAAQDLKGALADYDKSIELEGNDSETYNLRGVLKHTMQDYDGAIADYSKAIDIDDTNPVYYDNRALSKTEKENYAGAVEDYSFSISLYPGDPETYYQRGLVKLQMNNNYDGCLDLKHAEELGSDEAKAVIKKNFEIWVFETQFSGHAIQLAAEAATQGFDIIFSAGGDGTLNQVVNGVLKSGSSNLPTLGIIPLGSGNDFAGMMSISGRPEQLVKLLKENKPKSIDVGKISCLSKDGEPVTRYFINVCSLGMGPATVHRLERLPRWMGTGFRYYVSVLNTFLTHPTERFEVRASNWTWNGNARVIAIANGKSFGNKIYIAPEARPDDGKFSTFIATDMPLLKFLFVLRSVKMKKIVQDSRVMYEEATAMELTSPDVAWIETEGELAGLLPARINIEKGKVMFIG